MGPHRLADLGIAGRDRSADTLALRGSPRRARRSNKEFGRARMVARLGAF
jgi:hypothetical protein